MGKTYVHTNEEINKHIEQVLFKALAKQIYKSKDFQENVLNKREAS